jgi:hypothetical protein
MHQTLADKAMRLQSRTQFLALDQPDAEHRAERENGFTESQ